jgi:hypothetical protein
LVIYWVVGHEWIIPGAANHYRAFLSGSISPDPRESIGAGVRVDQLLTLPVLEVKDLRSRCSRDGNRASPRQAKSAPTALGNYKRVAFCPRRAHLDTATKDWERPMMADREPSQQQLATPPTLPGTARGPVAVPRCDRPVSTATFGLACAGDIRIIAASAFRPS